MSGDVSRRDAAKSIRADRKPDDVSGTQRDVDAYGSTGRFAVPVSPDLTWDQLGHVRHAAISLAVRTNTGVPLPEDALLAVAVHETGHALGLPHSADSADVMFPATRTSELSGRDLRTVDLLYDLTPGSVRELP